MGKITAYKVNNLSKVDLRFYKEGDHFITPRSVGMLTNGKMKILQDQSDLITELNDLKKRVKALEEVFGRNLVLDSEGMYSGTNTSMTHYFKLSPYATLNRINNATAISLDFDVITEDFTEGTIVLELHVIDENGTLRFIQNIATGLSRPQANHRVHRTIFLNELNYEINELNRVVMYARNFTGSVSIGNPKVSFSTTKSNWTPAPEDLQFL